MKFFRLVRIVPAGILLLLITGVVFAQAPFPKQLIASGGGLSLAQDSFYEALATRASTYNLSELRILVIPAGIGSNPNSITDAERKAQLAGAEQQRQEIEAGCQSLVAPDIHCTAILVPVITRSDALASPALETFAADPDGIYFLQNSAQAILEVIQATALTPAIEAVYRNGSVLCGPGDLYSRLFIRGYSPSFNQTKALTFGAILTDRHNPENEAAVFPEQAALDTYPFGENRLGRLLNVISGPQEPHIGIGIEAGAGFELHDDRTLTGFFGESVVAILDAQTYQSANGAIYQPGTNLIGLRNVLVHLFTSGNSSYDLEQMRSSLATPAAQSTRSFEDLKLPAGAGSLLLASNLLEGSDGMENLTEFSNLSGGQNATILILAAGYADTHTAEQEANQIRQALEVPSHTIIMRPDLSETVQVDPDITGIILTGPDPALIRLETLLEVKSSWLAGRPLLADRAGAAILGLHFSTSLLPDEQLAPFSAGRFSFQSGLGFIQANLEPHAFQNNSWERTLTIAETFPQELVLGLAPGASLHLSPDGAQTAGSNVTSLVDFRTVSMSRSENGVIEVANGFLDIYTPGELVQSLLADSQAAPIHAPTPALETATQPAPTTPTATVLLESEAQPSPSEPPKSRPPTRTPRPTSTPVPTPPPSDPGTTNLMVFFGVLSVVVVIVGVWLNRQIAVE